MPRLLVGDECDGIRFKYLAKPPSRDAPTFGRRDSLLDVILIAVRSFRGELYELLALLKGKR
jgi:hypothetical protein